MFVLDFKLILRKVGKEAWDRASVVAPEFSQQGLAQSLDYPGDCWKLLNKLLNSNALDFDFQQQLFSDDDILRNMNELLQTGFGLF